MSEWLALRVAAAFGCTTAAIQPRETAGYGYQALARSSYEEIYAVLEGSLGPQFDCGFCEHFAGSFRVGRIVLQRRPAANDA